MRDVSIGGPELLSISGDDINNKIFSENAMMMMMMMMMMMILGKYKDNHKSEGQLYR